MSPTVSQVKFSNFDIDYTSIFTICGGGTKESIKTLTSLPYFGVKLSCVCLMFAYRIKAYSYPKVT